MNWPAFANPWMLAALAAASLPVLIHFLTRARPKRVAFPPFKFLEEACAGQQAIHRLRTLLLLAIRTLAVLALVLLFARPFLKPSGSATAAQAAKRVVVILDASVSMRAVQNGVPLFSRAQSEAADVLRQLETGSEAAVILAGANPRPLLPALSQNIPALHEELVKAAATFERADLAAALALASRLLGGPGTLYIFSDFQKSNWEKISELPAGTVCRLRPVTAGPVENVGILSARTVPAEPVAGETAELLCTVMNCSGRPREELVRIDLAGFPQEKRVTIAPFATADAAFNVTFPQDGPFTGKATVQPDAFREDDSRHIAVRVRKALQVLLMSDTGAEDHRSAAFFVGRALVPSQESAPGIQIVRRHSQDADRGILETADVFLLVAPAAPSGEAVEIITRRVRDGARFLAILDGPTAPALIPASFNPPFRLERATASNPGDALTAGARPLFPEGDAADWSALKFRRHYVNRVLDGRSGEVLLAFPDGSAALTLSPVGSGAAAFLNFPLTPDGGDFVGSPLFPATLHELLRALRRGSDDRAILPGETWVMEAPTRGDAPLTVVGPDNTTIEARVLSSGRTTRLAMPAVRLPGVYLARQNETVVGAQTVNIAPEESDTRPIALENLKPGAGTAISVIRDEQDLLLAGTNRPLWPLLAGTAAVLLAIEMALLALWRPSRLRASLSTEEVRP